MTCGRRVEPALDVLRGTKTLAVYMESLATDSGMLWINLGDSYQDTGCVHGQFGCGLAAYTRPRTELCSLLVAALCSSCRLPECWGQRDIARKMACSAVTHHSNRAGV